MEFLGLSLPVLAAFVALLLGLALVARQLHALGAPRVVRGRILEPAAAGHTTLDRRCETEPDAG